MFAQDRDIRLPLDGSIDIDFHRRHLMDRRAVMTNFFSGAKTLVKPLVAVALIASALYVMPARDGTGWNGPTVSWNRPATSGTRLSSPSLATTVELTR